MEIAHTTVNIDSRQSQIVTCKQHNLSLPPATGSGSSLASLDHPGSVSTSPTCAQHSSENMTTCLLPFSQQYQPVISLSGPTALNVGGALPSHLTSPSCPLDAPTELTEEGSASVLDRGPGVGDSTDFAQYEAALASTEGKGLSIKDALKVGCSRPGQQQ